MRSLALPLALALVGLLAAPAAAQEVMRESRVYDIEFLTRHRDSYPGPVIKIRTGAEEAMPPMMDMEDESGQIDPDVLVQMIRANVDPDSWNNTKNSIVCDMGKLIVVQTRENLERIDVLLADLRARLGDFVEVEGFVLAVKLPYLAGLLGILESTSERATLDDKAVQSILGRAVNEGFVRVLDAASVLAFSGQRVNATTLEARRYVRDIDVEVAQEIGAEDPVVGMVEEGFVLDVRPVVGAGDSGILLDLHLGYQKLDDPMRTVEVGMTTLDLPSARHFQLRTTLVVPDGGAMLFAGLHPADGDEAHAFLVRARRKGLVAAPPKKGPAAPAGSRVLRIYNVRILTHHLERYAAGDGAMGLRSGDAGMAAPAFDEAMPEGMGLSGGELVALVCANIEEDSWANERNSIAFSGGCLVVVQTPEVHERIDAFLKSLRLKRAVLVMSVARYLEVDDGLLAEILPAGPAGSATHIDRAAREALLKAAGAGDRARTLALASHIAFNRQRTHIARRNAHVFVGDYDLEVAQAAGVLDPIMQTLQDGVLNDIECALAGDGKHVTLILRPSLSVARLPFDERKFKVGERGYVLHLPRVASERVQTDVTVPDGGAALFLGGRALTQKGRRLVLLVSVNVIRLWKE